MATSNLHTFISLFKGTDDAEEPLLNAIEIPIIQRDYAQGRKSKEVARIRNRFLTSLYEALTQNNPIKLDFIYGDIKEKKLIPLDGQQRLTTLFLLHWYIARHEEKDEKDFSFLKSFSYRTRYSAREFCQSLIDYTPDFTKEKITEDIEDQSWMPLDWRNDPTISSMLTMLDAIHSMFSDTSGLWERLNGGCISFYFLSIADMGLTDDLYIKMNSRGKPLTEFEHFKAEWEGYVAKIDDVTDLSHDLSRKIDTEWTDILWPYKGANNIIDDEFVKYYSYLCSLIYYKKYPKEERPDDILEFTKVLFFEKSSDAKDNLLFVEECFDCLNGIDIKSLFEKFLTQGEHVEGKSSISKSEAIDVFEDCCNNYGDNQSGHRRSFPIGRMILLYCFLLYLRKKISDDLFIRRLRIVNNLIKASEFELRDDRMNALLSQTEEIIERGEILIPDGRPSFNNSQLQEEKEKQEWLKDNKDKSETLFYLEDHYLLNGGISVVGLDNIGYTNAFYSLFSCDWSLVNRALLSIGDYSIKVNWRYQIGSARNDTPWRAVFRASNANTHETLCALLDRKDNFTNDYLKTIIDDYLNTVTLFDWRYYLIKYESMRPEKYGMYYWYDYKVRGKESYRILMMLTEKSIGGRNYNIFLKTLLDLDNSGDFSLGEYAYSGDGDTLISEKYKAYIKCLDDEYVVRIDGTDLEWSEPIDQINGVDKKDRIEVGMQLLDYIRKQFKPQEMTLL